MPSPFQRTRRKTRVLVYVREYFKHVYVPMFSSLEDHEVMYLTDFPTSGMLNIRDLFNSFLAKDSPVEFTDLDVDDIIIRCRLLRNLDRGLALRMISAMQRTMEAVITPEPGYDVIFGQMVDDYITHLMALIAERRGIRYMGLCGSYFSGCTHVTVGSDGSPADVREAMPAEAKQRLDAISAADFRQNYLQPTSHSFTSHAKRVLRYKAKLLAFPAMRAYRRDPLNYHYMVQPFVGQPKSLANHVNEDLFHKDWETSLRTDQQDLLYIPLGFTPEATTDYWIKDTRLIDYENRIIELVTYLSKHFKVIAKEHVHMLGIRDKDFYRRLGSIPNVISPPPSANSNRILLKYNPILLIGGGSAGVEATIRKIAVATYCDSSYWAQASRATQVQLDTNMELVHTLRSARPVDIDQMRFLQSCLATTFSFDYLKGSKLEGEPLDELRQFIRRERDRVGKPS